MSEQVQGTKTTLDAAKTEAAKAQYWLGEINAALRREKDFRKEGNRVLAIYYGQKKEQIPFNILYSNTETLGPALYNQTPRPVVQRRFKDDDPLGKASSLAGQRMLEFAVDTNSEEYSSYDDVMGDAVLDALLPGRAGTRVRYEAAEAGEENARYVKDELVCFESLKWDRWTHGFAKKWKNVPWVAFEHDCTQEAAKKLFGATVANKLTFSADTKSTDDEGNERPKDDKTDEDIKIAKVWEVWVKSDRQVLWVSPNYAEGFLKQDDDPLGLTSFYPMPEPLRLLRKANDLMPTAIYTLYENQAKELNRITVRINRVVEALKVRGAYDGQLGDDLNRILSAQDNVLIKADQVAALQEGGLEKAIWLMPIDKLIVVVQQLFLARNNCKQVIYEITGISDILRGSTVASETATAQQIKSQWGTLRLKRMQRAVAVYARDTLRIALEIAAKHFSEQTFAAMTGLPFSTTRQVQAANGQVAAARSQIAMTQAPMLMQASQQGGPQAMQQALQQALTQAVPDALKVLAQPHWDMVMQMMQSDTLRQYRIDIETNSTVDVEATEDQKQMSEVLTAMSQFIQGISPLVISGSMPFEVAQNMLLTVVRRYRMGTEIEDSIKAMKPPQSPDAGKQQAEQQKAAFELKKSQDEHNAKMAEMQFKAKLDQESMQLEAQLKREEIEFKREELRMKKELLIAQTMAKKAQLAAQVQAAHAMPKDKGPAAKPKEGANAAA